MNIYHLIFTFKEGNPSGGPDIQKESHVFINAETAEQIQIKVDLFLQNTQSGYRSHIQLVSITKL